MKRAFVTALFLSILPLAAQQPATEAAALRLNEQRELMSAKRIQDFSPGIDGAMTASTK